MLRGIDPLLNAELLGVLRAMGHGDDLIVVDTNFPAAAIAPRTVHGRVLRVDRTAAEALRAIVSVMPVDDFVEDATARMEVVGEPGTILPVMDEVQAVLEAAVRADGGTPKPMIGVERFAFYERAKRAYAVVQTQERRFYGCFAVRKGVVPPAEGNASPPEGGAS